MSDTLRPGSEDELAAIVADAAADKQPLEVLGTGTKAGIGHPLQVSARISSEALTGVTLYEPNELVIGARAGTPLSEIEATLDKNNQQLAFEPVDYGPLLGEGAGKGTIGAVFAANISGARRVQAGAARDHLLGIRAVNGRGEIFKSGGRVMKNVTGYDLVRTLAGSWGTLGIMSEVTTKVLPKAQETRTLLFRDLTDEVAVEAMCEALGSPFDVTGTVHLPASCGEALQVHDLVRKGQPVTLLRLENFSDFLDYRSEKLGEVLSAFGKMEIYGEDASHDIWRGIRQLKFFENGDGAVWRLSIAPDKAAKLVAAISAHVECRAVYDWSGGLVWLEVAPSRDAGATEIRRAVADIGGYATLIRAEPAVRASVDVFQPLDPGLAALTRKIKHAFDPEGILNPGRMYSGV